MFRFLFLSFLLLCTAIAQNAPNLTLPWGTWQASKYDPNGDFWTFQNVRFAKAPVGNLRFNAPVYPDRIANNGTLQNSTYGPSCINVDVTAKCTPGGDLGAVPDDCRPVPKGEFSEDCLFLDVYVPGSVYTNNSRNLPVVVWIYGGAYVAGSKNEYSSANVPLYSGTGVLRAAFNEPDLGQFIYVAGNYRLGAFGWLAGNYMELNNRSKTAVTNAGIYDQQLVLQFVQDYISQVGGDKNQVSAWGESAGAGSILHHLITKNGTRNPGFSKAIMQSPAFEWSWDRASNGTLDQVYNNFSRLAGCPDFKLDCLKVATTSQLAKANQLLFQTGTKCTGVYPVGPALDETLFTYLPAVALGTGRFWTGTKSLIISHVANETASFTPSWVITENDFNHYLNIFMPEPQLAEVRQAIKAAYPAQGPPYYGDQRGRIADVIRDSSFTCNTRWLYDAYRSIGAGTYMLQYDFLDYFLDTHYNDAIHASDLLPLFWNSDVDMDFYLRHCAGYSEIVADLIADFWDDYAQDYQTYFVRHAITGRPAKSGFFHIPWYNATVESGGDLTYVMETSTGLAVPDTYFDPITTDEINGQGRCGFWRNIALRIQQLGTVRGEEHEEREEQKDLLWNEEL